MEVAPLRRGEESEGIMPDQNAIMAADSAKLSAVPVITIKAERLGMVRSPALPSFIYLEPASRRINANDQRKREMAAIRAEATRQAAAEAAAAEAARTGPADPSNTSVEGAE